MSHADFATTSNDSPSLATASAKLAAGSHPISGTDDEPASHVSCKKSSNEKPLRQKSGTTKKATVERLLRRKSGATIDQIANATGWQAHTCRAFLTGLRKKGGVAVRETGKQGNSVYRIGTRSSDAKAG